MLWWCCGSSRASPYCPQCGVEHNGAQSLDGLLRYLTTKLENAQAREHAWNTKAGTHPTKLLKQNQRRASARAGRWHEWIVRLRALLDATETDSAEAKVG